MQSIAWELNFTMKRFLLFGTRKCFTKKETNSFPNNNNEDNNNGGSDIEQTRNHRKILKSLLAFGYGTNLVQYHSSINLHALFVDKLKRYL